MKTNKIYYNKPIDKEKLLFDMINDPGEKYVHLIKRIEQLYRNQIKNNV